jgi:branched-chain amino acid transport system permease protein
MSVRNVLTDGELGLSTIGVAIVVFTVFLALPFFLGEFEVGILTRILILAIFAMAFNIAFGFTNLPSFGHAAFFGIGAYGMALTMEYLEPGSIFVPLIIALLAAFVLSVIMGLASLRGKGIYFSLLTFAFAQFLYVVVFRWTEFTGGSDGVILSVPDVFGFSISGPMNVYYISLVLLAVFIVGMYRLLNSPFGKVMEAVRKNDERTGAVGYPVKRVQLTVFAMSGTLASLAGMLQAVSNIFVSPSTLFYQQSIDPLVVTIIGGSTTLLGPVVGSFILVLLREGTRELANIGTILTGVIFIGIILLAQDGVIGEIRNYFEEE